MCYVNGVRLKATEPSRLYTHPLPIPVEAILANLFDEDLQRSTLVGKDYLSNEDENIYAKGKTEFITDTLATLKHEFYHSFPSIPRDENGDIFFKVPGYGAEDLEISLKDDILSIVSLDRGKDGLPNNGNDTISTTLKLMNFKEIDVKSIKATCKKGLLTINIPKVKPKVTQIPIN